MPKINIDLPYNFTARDYQAPTWNAIIGNDFKRGAIVLPRRNGKDLLFWNACVAKAMQRTGLYFYIAPFYQQVRNIIWEGADGAGRRFLDYLPTPLVKKKTNLDMKIELVNGSIIKLLGSDVIDRIVGTNPVGLFFTEFSLHKPEAWDYLRPILAENGGFAWFNGTPRGLNHFYKMFKSAEKDPNWFTQYLTRDDTGIPTLEAIDEDRQSGMPESLIDQEYYVAWTASSEEVLIPLDIIEPCYDTKLREEDYAFEPRVMGVDVAYAAKGDQATITKRQGRMLWPTEAFRGVDNMAFASHIAKRINEWNPDAVFVDAGRGEGVISRLHQLGYNQVLPVHFGGATYSDLYFNKRAEMYCKARDWFMKENRPLIPREERMAESLSAPTFWINDKGFIQLESKKQIRKRLKRSPDEADGLVLTFAEEVAVPLDRMMSDRANAESSWKHLIQFQQNQFADSQYDVLNYFNGAEQEWTHRIPT